MTQVELEPQETVREGKNQLPARGGSMRED